MGARIILAVVGGVIGSVVPGIGTLAGIGIGSAIGGLIQGPPKVPAQGQYGQKPGNLNVPTVGFGQPIPRAWGSPRLPPIFAYLSEPRTISHTDVQQSGGGGKGGGSPTQTTVTVTYTQDVDVLILLCDNEILGVSRIWIDGELIWTPQTVSTPHWDRITIYPGASDQLPDPVYEDAVGAANASAYRGMGGVFIESWHLGNSGQMRMLTFEVYTKATYVDYSTLNAADTSADLTLSDDLLSATHTSLTTVDGGTYATSRAALGLTSGKWYWEVTFSVKATFAFIGVDDGDSNLQHYVGQETHGRGYASANGNRYDGSGGGGTAYGATWTAGDVIGVALDLDTGYITFYKNGVSQGAILLSLPGALYPAVSTLSLNDVFTVNFGQSAFAYPVPTGYNSGFYSTEYSPTAIVTPGTEALEDVVSDIFLALGLTVDQFDVSELATLTKPVRALSGIPNRAMLEMLATAYYFDYVMSGSVIKCVPRGGASVMTIPYADLGAAMGDQPSEPFLLRQATDIELPAKVYIGFHNMSNDYQDGLEDSDRLLTAVTNTTASIQLDIGLTPAEGKGIAVTVAADQKLALITAPIALLGDYSALEPTDVITITDRDGDLFDMRIVQLKGQYPLIELDLVLDDPNILIDEAETNTDYTSSDEVAAIPDALMELMDIPILRDADDDCGIYGALKGDGTPYPGGSIFRSPDWVTYSGVADVGESAVFGNCDTTLGDWTGPRVFDHTHILRVDVGAGELSSGTRDTVLNDGGANLLLVGSEVIQFISAELISTGIYDLTGLLRGCRGTEWAMVDHAADERCVLLRPAGLRRINLINSQLGLEFFYKGVTFGRTLSGVTAEPFTDTGVGKKPFSLVGIRAARDSSNNIVFTLQRRSRYSVRMIGSLGISLPLGEELERYEIDIYTDDTYSTLARATPIVATSATVAYSAADQTTDGLTPGDPVYARAYQISATVGRGYKLEATV